MNESKRFIRSSASGTINSREKESIKKEEIALKNKVENAIVEKDFHKAMSLLKAATQKDRHWVQCLRAEILYQLGKVTRALMSVRDSLKEGSEGCISCFKLLLNIIKNRHSDPEHFRQDIQKCLRRPNLPNDIRNDFQSIKLEYHNPQMSEPAGCEFQQLTNYYQKKGLIFKKVEIVEMGVDYRIAKAKSTIPAQQEIIFVPEKEIITLQVAKKLPFVKKLAIQQSKLQSPKHCMLAVFLLFHLSKGKNSPYFNYIQCLPKRLQSFPIYYEKQLLQQLKNTYFQSILLKRKKDIAEDYRNVIDIISDPTVSEFINPQKFNWARMVVSSRIFGVFINNQKTDALVPIADMLNHKIPKLTNWYFCDTKKGFVVKNAKNQIKKGQQIFDSYGSKCNSRFLLNYGFVMPANSYNEVMIILQKHKSSKATPPNIRLTTELNSEVFKNLIAYYRHEIYQATVPEQSTEDSETNFNNFVSKDNEMNMWNMIDVTMREQMSTYNSSIKEDEKLLQSKNLSPNLRNCIEIRLGEMKIFDFYIRMSKKMIDFLGGKKKCVDLSVYEPYLKDIPGYRGRTY